MSRSFSYINRSALTTLMIAIVVLLIGVSFAQAQQLKWQSDVDTAAQMARTQGKLVLLHFTTKESRDGMALERFVFNNPALQRVFNDNVVGVKIDALKNKSLTQEYAVSSIPFDIVMTPAGRIVTKRKSPTNSSSYQKMLSDLSVIINALDEGNDPALAQSLAEIEDNWGTTPKYDGQPVSFTPTGPTHQQPAPSAHSLQLRRTSAAAAKVVKNPFMTQQPQQRIANAYQPTQDQQRWNGPATQTPKPQPQVQQNTFHANVAPGNVEWSKNPYQPQQQVQQLPQAQSQKNPLVPEGVLPPRNIQSIEQSDVAAKLIQQKAEQKRRSFVPEPKIVMDDKFFGSSTPTPEKIASGGNYHAKITLPAEEPQVPVESTSDEQQYSGPLVENKSKVPAMQVASGRSIKEAPSSPVETGLAEASVKPAQPKFALRGKCPVSLLTKGVWEDGDDQFGCIHRNRIYIFTSAEALATFQEDPDAYSPVLAGYDPVVYNETGKLEDGKEQFGVFMGKAPNRRTVLFATQENRAKFQANPRIFLETVHMAMSNSGGGSSELVR